MRVEILQGDARKVLATLPDKSVQCVVTSPPYFGLRDYGTATWEGGSTECDHVVGAIRTGLGMAALGERYAGGGHKASEPKPLTAKGQCPKCGAVRVDQQIGLESTSEAYIASMVEVFRDVWRVLRDDGTCWLNLGDGFNNFRVSKGPGQAVHGRDKLNGKPAPDSGRRGSAGFKEKDLLMIPARVAIALQADGWYLRSDVIWTKPNPMPESVTDRPTSSHEHVFLLTKKPAYYYDAEAVKEGATRKPMPMQASPAAMKAKSAGPMARGEGINHQFRDRERLWAADGTRNLRNVWNIATTPYPGSHFAVFPQKLAETCIKAGTSEKGCCPICKTPWVRIVIKDEPDEIHRAASGADKSGGYNGQATKDYAAARAQNASDVKRRILEGMRKRTYQWRQNCTCAPADPVPCTVLDPFAGAGTVGVVCASLGRDAVLIELNQSYVDMAAKRIRDHAEKLKINCCVVSPESLSPEKPPTEKTKVQITLTLDISPTTSPIAVQQLLDWAVRINAGQTVGEAIAPLAKTSQVQALFNQLVETKLPDATEETATVQENQQQAPIDQGNQQQVSQGAVPPGIEAPAKRKGGRPSKAEVAAREAAAAAAAAQQAAPVHTNGAAALPPGVSNGARPPGVGPAVSTAPPALPAQNVQQPAMPEQEEFSDGFITKEDVRSCYAQAVGHNPKGVHAIMRAAQWPDGEPKPQWFTIDGVAPVHFDRLVGELSTLIPAQ